MDNLDIKRNFTKHKQLCEDINRGGNMSKNCQLKQYSVLAWLTEKQYDRLNHYCEVKSLSRSQFIRSLILEAIKDFEKEE